MEVKQFSPAVLLFHVQDPVKKARIGNYLRAKHIRMIEVAAKDLHQPIGLHLELPGIAREPGLWFGPELGEEMMVMFAFQGTMMREFLQFFRDEGLQPISLKAVATPTNISWSALDLFQELQKERAYFQSAKETGRS